MSRVATPNSKYSVHRICPNCGIHFKLPRNSIRSNPYCDSCKSFYIHKSKGKKHSSETNAKISSTRKHLFAIGVLDLKAFNNPRWKGGLSIEKGRIKESQHFDHPCCDSKGRVFLSRLIAEKVIGRYLASNEIVHHADENPHNNENNNLLLCTQSFHMFLHNKMRKRKAGG